MRPKIALIAASWDGEMLEAIVNGIRKKLSEIGWDLHVFTCFPVIEMDDPENVGNYNIFSLSKYSDYEGYLLSVNVINGVEMLKKYHNDILKLGKPIVTLDQKIEGFSSILPDGYTSMYKLVEHLIINHNCKVMNYVGGGLDHPDNIIRKKAFRDAMAAHNLPVEEDRIRDYWFTDSSGRMAYEQFKEVGKHLPDAVVCANDAMALGYCQAAEADGFYPPKNFLITGYDNDDNARSFSPKISTVEKKAERMGYEGCSLLLSQIENHTLNDVENHTYMPELVFHGSCGCYSEDEMEEMDVRQVHRKMYNMKKDLQQFYENISSIRQGLALANDEKSFCDFLQQIFEKYDIYGFALCINEDVYLSSASLETDWVGSYCKRQCVLTGMHNKIREEEMESIPTKQMYPKYLRHKDDETHVYMFVPIQKNGQNMGYVVIVDGNFLFKRRFILNLSGAINNAYSNLRNVQNIVRMNKFLDGVYTMDAMTNLYNRFGYMRAGYEIYEKSKMNGFPLIVMFMDMNGLKKINDEYGHSAGDNALTMFAEVLKQVAGEDKLAIRYGGDEFLIIGPVEDKEDAERFRLFLEAALEERNQAEKLPYKLDTSIGYVLTDIRSKKDLEDYVKEADALMYAEKKRTKKERVD